jgi:hypothetical protein
MKTQLVLTRAHTHAGRQHQAGARIEVDADLAQWLLSVGSARAVTPPTKSEATTAREAQPFQRKESKS